VQSSKRGKLTFEIVMQEKGCHLLAAESEVELDEWVTALKRALEFEDTQAVSDRIKDRGTTALLSGALKTREWKKWE